MVDPAFRERYLRSKRPKTLAKIMRMKRTAKCEVNSSRRAALLLAVDDAGGDFEAAALAAGTNVPALRTWLYNRTGTTKWPLSETRREKLRAIAERHK